jgi:hypothetical protein
MPVRGPVVGYAGAVNRLPFILRDQREELRRRWHDALPGRVSDEYAELLASPVGDRLLRGLVEQLVAVSQAEEYEVPGLRRRYESEFRQDVQHRLALGFAARDLAGGVQAVRLAVLDVLGDAVVGGESPPPGETLVELRALDDFLDGLVGAVLDAAAPPS